MIINASVMNDLCSVDTCTVKRNCNPLETFPLVSCPRRAAICFLGEAPSSDSFSFETWMWRQAYSPGPPASWFYTLLNATR